MKELKFASTNEALQHLANVTGKRVKVASSNVDSARCKSMAREAEKVFQIGRGGSHNLLVHDAPGTSGPTSCFVGNYKTKHDAAVVGAYIINSGVGEGNDDLAKAKEMVEEFRKGKKVDKDNVSDKLFDFVLCLNESLENDTVDVSPYLNFTVDSDEAKEVK